LVRSERIDPKVEASAVEIAAFLQKTQVISISCGDDVDMQSCKFFVNSLQSHLDEVEIHLFYEPETELFGVTRSFFVTPRLLPSSAPGQVTLRLIEMGNPQALYVGGTCFDLSDPGWGQHRVFLPQWRQVEEMGDNDFGPLESDKARAASILARTFSSYWTKTQLTVAP
jgi:hypothetical protein